MVSTFKTMNWSLVAALMALSGCLTSHVMDEARVADGYLTCAEIKKEIYEAKHFEGKAKEEGRSGLGDPDWSLADLLLLPLTVFFTYTNVDEAVGAAERRQEHLEKLYQEKGC